MAESASNYYRPQLDALRAIAVSGVLVQHFLPVGRFILSDFLTIGLLAVRFFFVLSGYLITGILLRGKVRPFGIALRDFYLRRTLRIFPIYYLTLACLILANISTVRQFAWWHALYLSNILFTLDPGAAGLAYHLWTLSVEEQFYLVWPFLVLLTPYRHLPGLILGAVVAALGWKATIAVALLVDPIGGAMLTPGCLDSLALGAALAFVEQDERAKVAREKFLRGALFFGSYLVLVQTLLYLADLGRVFVDATAHLGVSLVCVWLVGRAADGFGGYTGKLFESKAVVFVGRISYGMYLFHNFMPGLVLYFVAALGLRPLGTVPMFLCASMMTVLLASISWFLIERPINRFKKRYPSVEPGALAV